MRRLPEHILERCILAVEEEGFTFDNKHGISISTWCTGYDAAETAGEEPSPQPISQSMAEYEITLG